MIKFLTIARNTAYTLAVLATVGFITVAVLDGTLIAVKEVLKDYNILAQEDVCK